MPEVKNFCNALELPESPDSVIMAEYVLQFVAMWMQTGLGG